MFAKRKSPNKLKVTMVIGAKPWLADTQHPLYEAGKAAVKRGTETHTSPHISHVLHILGLFLVLLVDAL